MALSEEDLRARRITGFLGAVRDIEKIRGLLKRARDELEDHRKPDPERHRR